MESLWRWNLVVASEKYKQECERNRPDHWFLARDFRRMVRLLIPWDVVGFWDFPP
jgi:hypothetical protein